MDPYEPGGGKMHVPTGDDLPWQSAGRRTVISPKGMCPEDLFHISDWPAHLTEFDNRLPVVLFHDEQREFKIGFTHAQIRWHRIHDAGSPLNFRRLVSAALKSTRVSHETGGDRVRRTWRSPFSVVISK